MTPAHIKRWFAGLASGKKKKKADTLAAHEQGPPVQLTACGGTETENQAHLLMARQSPGYVFVKELVADSVARRADRVMLDYTKEAVGVRYEIDGVWHNVEPRDRESGDVMLAVMKKISSLNMDERRARQEGEFKAKYWQQEIYVAAGQSGNQVGRAGDCGIGARQVALLVARIAGHAGENARRPEGRLWLTSTGWCSSVPCPWAVCRRPGMWD